MLESIRKFALRKCLNPNGPALVDGVSRGGKSIVGERTPLFVCCGAVAAIVVAGGMVAAFVLQRVGAEQQAAGAGRVPVVSGKETSEVPGTRPASAVEPPVAKPAVAPGTPTTQPATVPPPRTGPHVQQVTSFNGRWSGPWTSSLGGKGTSYLKLTTDANGVLSGTWDDVKEIKGRRVDKNTIVLQEKMQTAATRSPAPLRAGKSR